MPAELAGTYNSSVNSCDQTQQQQVAQLPTKLEPAPDTPTEQSTKEVEPEPPTQQQKPQFVLLKAPPLPMQPAPEPPTEQQGPEPPTEQQRLEFLPPVAKQRPPTVGPPRPPVYAPPDWMRHGGQREIEIPLTRIHPPKRQRTQRQSAAE